jgi:triacylglycerol lipase
MTPPRRARTAPAKRKAPAPRVVKCVAPEPPNEPVAPPAPAPLADWELAYLALYAEDAFSTALKTGGDLKSPPPDPRLAPDWKILGTLTAVDAPLRIGKYKVGAREVFYGWLLEGRGRRVLAIRGTGCGVEWLIDGLFAPRAEHPVTGRVESGFWSVYASMGIGGKPITDFAVDVVVGHSLGAALATYAALELAQAGSKVRGVFVASPHPGDAEFCKAFGAAVPDHVMYRNARDYVPKVPFWFGYTDVPNVRMLSATGSAVTITGGPPGQHHILSYAALMHRDALRSFKPLPIDQPFLDCISISS